MKLTRDIVLTPLELAAAFCELNDEQQAQFFIECAALSQSWKGLGSDWQWWSVGRHLKICSCSNECTREMVKAISDAANT